MNKVNYAEVYIIISPSGKKYVGKANCLTCRNKEHGTYGRWKTHIYDSRKANGGRCRLLNEEIRLHDKSLFKITPILTCHKDNVAKYEKELIKEYNTLYDKVTNPNGLNILSGGNCGNLPDTVRELMSLKRRSQPSKGPPKESTRKMISDTLISNVKRYDHNNNQLPKYVKHVKWNDRIGYQIVSHPLCKCKYFVSKKDSLDSLYQKCIIFLDSLNIKGSNC